MEDLLSFGSDKDNRYFLSKESGQRIAIITQKGKKGSKDCIYLYDKKYICCTECSEGKKKKCGCCGVSCGFNKYHDGKPTQLKSIKAPEGTSFMITPTNLNNQVSNLFITGRQGLGKSVFVAKYVEQSKQFNKDLPIYLISEAREDKTLDPLINKRITPSQIKEDELKFEDFEDIAKEYGGAIIIFDDIDSLTDKKPDFLKKNTYALINSIINLSRKNGISVIYTSHTILDGTYSKTMINSCSNWVFFSAGINKQTLDCLNKKFGLSKEQIKKVLTHKNSTKWFSVNNTAPITITTENETFIL